MRSPTDRLRDMLGVIDRIQRYSSLGRARFDSDELIQSWIVHHLQVIGEAARALPEVTRVGLPDIPWPAIIGMRHILVHDYFQVDTEIVWNVIEHDLEPLARHLRRAVEDSS